MLIYLFSFLFSLISHTLSTMLVTHFEPLNTFKSLTVATVLQGIYSWKVLLIYISFSYITLGWLRWQCSFNDTVPPVLSVFKELTKKWHTVCHYSRISSKDIGWFCKRIDGWMRLVLENQFIGLTLIILYCLFKLLDM